MSMARSLYHWLIHPPSTNYNLKQLTHNPYTMLPAEAVVLDVGSSNTKGRYASFVAVTKDIRIIALDIEKAEGIDVVADVHHLPFLSETIDAVFCVSVLEYVQQPPQALNEILRILKPGGLLYLNVPFVFRYAPEPEDLYRFSLPGLRDLCSAFEEIQGGYNRGPASTMCDLLVHFAAIVFCFNNRRLYGILVDLFQWCLFWMKYLDRWIGHYEVAHTICSGVFFFGRKPYVSEITS